MALERAAAGVAVLVLLACSLASAAEGDSHWGDPFPDGVDTSPANSSPELLVATQATKLAYTAHEANVRAARFLRKAERELLYSGGRRLRRTAAPQLASLRTLLTMSKDKTAGAMRRIRALVDGGMSQMPLETVLADATAASGVAASLGKSFARFGSEVQAGDDGSVHKMAMAEAAHFTTLHQNHVAPMLAMLQEAASSQAGLETQKLTLRGIRESMSKFTNYVMRKKEEFNAWATETRALISNPTLAALWDVFAALGNLLSAFFRLIFNIIKTILHVITNCGADFISTLYIGSGPAFGFLPPSAPMRLHFRSLPINKWLVCPIATLLPTDPQPPADDVRAGQEADVRQAASIEITADEDDIALNEGVAHDHAMAYLQYKAAAEHFDDDEERAEDARNARDEGDITKNIPTPTVEDVNESFMYSHDKHMQDLDALYRRNWHIFQHVKKASRNTDEDAMQSESLLELDEEGMRKLRSGIRGTPPPPPVEEHDDDAPRGGAFTPLGDVLMQTRAKAGACDGSPCHKCMIGFQVSLVFGTELGMYFQVNTGPTSRAAEEATWRNVEEDSFFKASSCVFDCPKCVLSKLRIAYTQGEDPISEAPPTNKQLMIKYAKTAAALAMPCYMISENVIPTINKWIWQERGRRHDKGETNWKAPATGFGINAGAVTLPPHFTQGCIFSCRPIEKCGVVMKEKMKDLFAYGKKVLGNVQEAIAARSARRSAAVAPADDENRDLEVAEVSQVSRQVDASVNEVGPDGDPDRDIVMAPPPSRPTNEADKVRKECASCQSVIIAFGIKNLPFPWTAMGTSMYLNIGGCMTCLGRHLVMKLKDKWEAAGEPRVAPAMLDEHVAAQMMEEQGGGKSEKGGASVPAGEVDITYRSSCTKESVGMCVLLVEAKQCERMSTPRDPVESSRLSPWQRKSIFTTLKSETATGECKSVDECPQATELASRVCNRLGQVSKHDLKCGPAKIDLKSACEQVDMHIDANKENLHELSTRAKTVAYCKKMMSCEMWKEDAENMKKSGGDDGSDTPAPPQPDSTTPSPAPEKDSSSGKAGHSLNEKESQAQEVSDIEVTLDDLQRVLSRRAAGDSFLQEMERKGGKEFRHYVRAEVRGVRKVKEALRMNGAVIPDIHKAMFGVSAVHHDHVHPVQMYNFLQLTQEDRARVHSGEDTLVNCGVVPSTVYDLAFEDVADFGALPGLLNDDSTPAWVTALETAAAGDRGAQPGAEVKTGAGLDDCENGGQMQHPATVGVFSVFSSKLTCDIYGVDGRFDPCDLGKAADD